MSNFITALQAATAHTYKGKGKNGAAIKAAAEEGYKSTDLRNPDDKRSTTTEADWLALKLSAAKGLTTAQFKAWQLTEGKDFRHKQGSKEAKIAATARDAINDTIKCIRRGIERLENALAKAEEKSKPKAKESADNHDKAIKMLSTLNDFLKKHLSEGSSVETHKLASLMQKVIIADTKNTAEVPH